ncbi:hypothetical protein [Burkholderia ubonensis]|uniref:hypothetical protein n=1 Tax=Burkholderia ubonensis TaxID=101571 RepID=UPI0009B3638E|nr:hypothetical protein [Burkholderia ubonensis]
MDRTLIVAALLALSIGKPVAAFARGQPQLPDDNGDRASVLAALNPWLNSARGPSCSTADMRTINIHGAPIERAPTANPHADNSTPGAG